MAKQNNIPLSRVFMDSQIKAHVARVLERGQYILERECRLFEEEFARFAGTKYAALVNSGTAAIWLSLIALGVRPKDEILVPSLTAFPTVEPILYLGAKPVFVEVDNTYTMDMRDLEKKITAKTAGAIPVHLYGHPANLKRLFALARKHKFFILEDCCQAHGARFGEKKVGSFGAAGCFSFYPSKNLTVCGDGGMVVTNDSRINDKIRLLRDHGRESRYLHRVLGYNFRCNEIQAAVGREMLKKLNSFNGRRREIANLYAKKLAGLPLVLPHEEHWAHHVYHLFVINLEGRDKLAEFLLKKGIATGIHYPVPCHLQPPVIKKFGRWNLPVTENICGQILSLPIFPILGNRDIGRVATEIGNFFKR